MVGKRQTYGIDACVVISITYACESSDIQPENIVILYVIEFTKITVKLGLKLTSIVHTYTIYDKSALPYR